MASGGGGDPADGLWRSTAALLLCLLAGGLLGLGTVGPLWRCVGWTGLVAFAFLCSRQTKPLLAYFAGFLAAMAYHAIGLVWMSLCLEGTFASVWFFSCLGGTLAIGVGLALGRAFLRATGLPMALGFPFVWLTCEWLRYGLFVLADGNGMVLLWQGMAFAEATHLAQIADIGGVSALTWLVACLAGGAYDVLEALLRPTEDRSWRMLRGGGIAVACLVSVWAYGHWRLAQPVEHDGPTIGLLSGHPSAAIGAKAIPGKVDLCVWPETATPGYLYVEPSETAGTAGRMTGEPAVLLPRLSRQIGAAVLAGVRRVEGRGSDEREYNSVAYVDKERIEGLYDKRHLAPFVEYAPWWMIRLGWSVEEVFPLTGVVGSKIHRGTRADPCRLKLDATGRPVRVAPAVCYDVCFPDVHRLHMRAADGPPDLFVCVMNESFDSSGIVANLSLLHTRLRAIECRRPYYRVSEGGVSAIVDSCGRVLQQARELGTQEKSLVGRAPADRRVTVYVAWGEWLPVASLLVVVGGGVWPWIGRASCLRLRRKTVPAETLTPRIECPAIEASRGGDSDG